MHYIPADIAHLSHHLQVCHDLSLDLVTPARRMVEVRRNVKCKRKQMTTDQSRMNGRMQPCCWLLAALPKHRMLQLLALMP